MQCFDTHSISTQIPTTLSSLDRHEHINRPDCVSIIIITKWTPWTWPRGPKHHWKRRQYRRKWNISGSSSVPRESMTLYLSPSITTLVWLPNHPLPDIHALQLETIIIGSPQKPYPLLPSTVRTLALSKPQIPLSLSLHIPSSYLSQLSRVLLYVPRDSNGLLKQWYRIGPRSLESLIRIRTKPLFLVGDENVSAVGNLSLSSYISGGYTLEQYQSLYDVQNYPDPDRGGCSKYKRWWFQKCYAWQDYTIHVRKWHRSKHSLKNCPRLGKKHHKRRDSCQPRTLRY